VRVALPMVRRLVPSPISGGTTKCGLLLTFLLVGGADIGGVMCGGSLFAQCCGLFSRVHRGGRGLFWVRVCPQRDTLGVPLVGATYRSGYSGGKS